AYRLDTRVRFVASPAQLLKASCAAWAQQRRIAVVPIDAKAAASSDDPRAELFALLSQALWRRDVFDDPEPVTNPAEFFGRELYVQELVTRVLLGQPSAVFGLRRIGKTSLLGRVRELLDSDRSTVNVTAFLRC